jgi:hypothetical protein
MMCVSAEFFKFWFNLTHDNGNHHRKASTLPMGPMKSGIASTSRSRSDSVYEKRRS